MKRKSDDNINNYVLYKIFETLCINRLVTKDSEKHQVT